MRALLAVLAAVTTLAAAGAEGAVAGEELLQVLTPAPKSVAPAHPHVNVIVLFGTTADGATVDPRTFRARLNGRDVTGRFVPLADGDLGGAPGVRAALDDSVVRLGATNRLRLRVRSVPAAAANGHTRRLKDKDRLRFTAVLKANRPPVARLGADQTVVIPGVPIRFDASRSSDPELDALAYSWQFGDGGSAEGIAPEHTWDAASADGALVRLAVSDGADTGEAWLSLLAEPTIDPDRTKGRLVVDADGPLEFGGVAVGAEATRVLRVGNADVTPTSQLRVRATAAGAGFTVEPAELDLGPSETGTLRVRFAPDGPGHAGGVVSLAASASTRSAVTVLVHGYGGEAPGHGPTLAARTAYHAVTVPEGYAVRGIRPDGSRFTVDTAVHLCQTPGDGPGTGDACLTDADCAPLGGTCDRAVSTPLAPEDLCADPEGNVVVLSVDGAVTDPDPAAETARTTVLYRASHGADGAPLGKALLARVTGGTTNLACDDLPRGAQGRAYVAEYFDVDDDACDRTEREALTAVRKDGGVTTRLESRLDAIQGLDACNDYEDATAALAATGPGTPFFVSFDLGGVWRREPRRQFVTSLDDSEPVAAHPDGALLHATAVPAGAGTALTLYKVSATRVETGPLASGSLVPCASFTVPNNDGIGFVRALAVAPAADDPASAVALVSFVVSHEGVKDVLAPALAVQGTVAFSVPAGDADACDVVGLTTLDLLDLLSF